MKTKKPRIFVYVEGGMIQTIVSDSPVDIMVLDGDVEGSDVYETYKEVDGTPFKARKAWNTVEIHKKIINHFFKQREKING